MFSLFLVIILAFSTLSGCGGDARAESRAETESTAAPVTATEEGSASKEETQAASEETDCSGEDCEETECAEGSCAEPACPDDSCEEPFDPEDCGICAGFEDPGEVPLTEEARFSFPVETDSKSYCVLDEDGTILLEKNASWHLKPASLTKILTALVVVEEAQKAHPDEDLVTLLSSEKATVSETAVTQVDVMSSGISPSLKPGEEFSVKDLLYILLLPSTNAAGNVLQEYTAGSGGRFSALMNAKCEALGLKNSHFENPHGLDANAHYSCAYDQAVILKAACENDYLCRILGATNYTVPATASAPERTTTVGHEMLNGSYPVDGAFAGKNGWTIGGNATLATAFERNGHRIYVATMNSDERFHFRDTERLADAAYQLLAGNETPSIRPLGYDFMLTTEEGGKDTLTFRVSAAQPEIVVVCWNQQEGPEHATVHNETRVENGKAILDLGVPGAPGIYTIQVFIKDANGLEAGFSNNMLYTGKPETLVSIVQGNDGTYFVNGQGFLSSGAIELPFGCYFADPETFRVQYANFVTSGPNRFYVSAEGPMVTGLVTIGEHQYYFQPDGRMAKGNYRYGGVSYELSEEGILLSEE